VVAMRMGEQQVRPYRAFLGQGEPELSRTGPAVEDQQRAVVGHRLDAGRVSAEALRVGSGRGDRSTGAPETKTDLSALPVRGP